LQWHLERALRSLPLVDRGAPAAGAVPSPGGAGPDVVPPRSGAGPVAGVNREMTE
ncbi:DNA repair protein RecO, partial [Micromonospora aurantiaca]